MTIQPLLDPEPHLRANRHFWCDPVGSLPDADLPIYRSDVGSALCNGVLRVRNRPLDKAIDDARRQLAGTRWSWWVGPDSEEGTAEGLIARGAEPSVVMSIMTVDVSTVTDPTAANDVSIGPVTGRAELQEYVQAYATVFGYDQNELGRAIEHEQRLVPSSVVRLAAVADGRTVGTCTVSLLTEIGALYYVTTHQGWRRQGIATALTREALHVIRESGRRVATLQASSDGELVYRGLGFQTVGQYRLFTLPE